MNRVARAVISGVVIALLAACDGGGYVGDDEITAMYAPTDGGGVAHALAAAPARKVAPLLSTTMATLLSG